MAPATKRGRQAATPMRVTLFGRQFMPRLWPTAIAAAGLMVLVTLGAWQLDRRAWKVDLLDRIADRLDAAPVPLPTVIGDPADWDFARVIVSGRLAADRTLPLMGRIHQGRPGAYWLTPLIPPPGPPRVEARPAILVNRGWVPLERVHQIGPGDRSSSTRPPTVTVTGVLRLPAEPGWVTPANDTDANEWYAVDIAAMAAATGLEAVLPLVLTPDPPPLRPEADVEAAGRAPVPVPTTVRVTIPNNHLKYALTWFGLAAALVAVYLISQSRKVPP